MTHLNIIIIETVRILELLTLEQESLPPNINLHSRILSRKDEDILVKRTITYFSVTSSLTFSMLSSLDRLLIITVSPDPVLRILIYIVNSKNIFNINLKSYRLLEVYIIP